MSNNIYNRATVYKHFVLPAIHDKGRDQSQILMLTPDTLYTNKILMLYIQ